MQTEIVMPRFRLALAPEARVAVVDTETSHSGDWRPEMLDIIRRYSPLEHHLETHEMVSGLVKQGLFVVEGEERTASEPFDQSVDEYLRPLGSTSTLSRFTLGSRAPAFEAECRDLFARRAMERIRSDIVAYVAWGRPA